MSEEKQLYGADLVVDSLINHDVDYVFGIPGAKIDRVFDTLEDKGPELIVARHEQNAAFMAQAVGRLTGKPGVALVTSGPGVSNLATGLITANSEGDPVVAIGGQVKRSDLLKQTHQSMDNVSLLRPVTKSAVEVGHQDSISEAITNAFRKAKEPKKGATFVSLPADVINEKTSVKAIKRLREPILGIADPKHVSDLVEKIENADIISFKVLNEDYAKDKNHIYRGSEAIDSSLSGKIKDPETFEFLPNGIIYGTLYGKDKYNVYYIENKMINCFDTYYSIYEVNGINKDKVEVMNDWFIKDDLREKF